MSRNLREKLSVVLDEIADLHKIEALKVLERMVSQELEFLEIERELEHYDLNLIRDKAAYNWQYFNRNDYKDTCLNSNEELIRTYCYVEAVIGHLRSKGLIKFTTEVKGKNK